MKTTLTIEFEDTKTKDSFVSIFLDGGGEDFFYDAFDICHGKDFSISRDGDNLTVKSKDRDY